MIWSKLTERNSFPSSSNDRNQGHVLLGTCASDVYGMFARGLWCASIGGPAVAVSCLTCARCSSSGGSTVYASWCVMVRAAADVPGHTGAGLDYAAARREEPNSTRTHIARARHPQACNHPHLFWPNERPAN
jgi:hypothetical protein